MVHDEGAQWRTRSAWKRQDDTPREDAVAVVQEDAACIYEVCAIQYDAARCERVRTHMCRASAAASMTLLPT